MKTLNTRVLCHVNNRTIVFLPPSLLLRSVSFFKPNVFLAPLFLLPVAALPRCLALPHAHLLFVCQFLSCVALATCCRQSFSSLFSHLIKPRTAVTHFLHSPLTHCASTSNKPQPETSLPYPPLQLAPIPRDLWDGDIFVPARHRRFLLSIFFPAVNCHP